MDEKNSPDPAADSLISPAINTSGWEEILDLRQGPLDDTRRYDPMWSNLSILDLASSPSMLLDPLNCRYTGPLPSPGAIAVPESACVDAHQAWWRSNQVAAIPQLDTLSGLVSVAFSDLYY